MGRKRKLASSYLLALAFRAATLTALWLQLSTLVHATMFLPHLHALCRDYQLLGVNFSCIKRIYILLSNHSFPPGKLIKYSLTVDNKSLAVY